MDADKARLIAFVNNPGVKDDQRDLRFLDTPRINRENVIAVCSWMRPAVVGSR